MLPTSLNSETCVNKGLCPIRVDYSSRPRNIYYEVHGDLNASQKLVFIQCLGFSCSGWEAQVQHFSAKKDHAVLVFDNRGTGNSDAGPIEAYKSSEMAKDTLALLKWLGWVKDRSIHLLGVSLGGMIAQELCLLIPERIKSVAFISTRCGSELDLPSNKAMYTVLKTSSKIVTGDQAVDLYLELLFPDQHFDESTEEGKRYKSRMREQIRNCYQLPREQAPRAFWAHFYASMMHHCSHDKLNKIAAELYPAKILVINGDADGLVLPKRSLELHQHLPGSELIVINNAGHALSYQITEEFHKILDRVVEEGNVAFSTI
ncbi:hypothetical protein PCANC_25206 [Puccinia coronata f. sp. avenae]|uniref:AB hydrolase-1 domain-containing protein n=1 Tax=Puccinia coronata f. sp. avenae TaxID=200324 RepID=A0A2N5US19_9BASI|nr:hypothetical protein PCANC_25206 [Puccinia coronata f. sp. avenae]PLW40568.1 hypothetical protein PCASD_07796 [Puccinia coronata f. sp. avenae]